MGLPAHLVKTLPPGARVLMTRIADPPTPAPAEPSPKLGRHARVTKGPDGKNKTERAYGVVLEDRKRAGEVWDYLFDAVNFRLGEKCFYKPDYLVYLEDGSIEVHEVKGFMEDDARVKVRAFVEKFHIPLVIVRRRKGAWDYERLEAKG